MEMNKELTINLKDYVSDERIVEIAEEEIRKAFRRLFMREQDTLRIMSNMAYEAAFRILSKVWEEHNRSLTDDLVRMMNKVIQNESSMRYVMFQDGEYGHPKSVAYRVMEEESEMARPLIRMCIEEHIRNYPFHELEKDAIGDAIYSVIMDKILEAK